MTKLSCESSNTVFVSFMGGSILTNAIIHLSFVDINQNLLLGLSLLGGIAVGLWIYKHELKKEN